MLEMECAKCCVSPTCPRRGSSPLSAAGTTFKCRLVGGYGRVPVDPSKLSAASKEVAERDGPCLTIAEVPVEDGEAVLFEIVKIFAPPVLSARESTIVQLDAQYPRSHARR